MLTINMHTIEMSNKDKMLWKVKVYKLRLSIVFCVQHSSVALTRWRYVAVVNMRIHEVEHVHSQIQDA